jgi:hypothetical protein
LKLERIKSAGLGNRGVRGEKKKKRGFEKYKKKLDPL